MLRWFIKRDRATVRSYRILLGGITLTTAGAIGTLAFLHEILNGRKIPPGQIATRLILPHIALLAGFGLILAAIILLHKHAVIRERQKEDQPLNQ